MCIYIYISSPLYTSPSPHRLLGEKPRRPFGVLDLKLHRFSEGLQVNNCKGRTVVLLAPQTQLWCSERRSKKQQKQKKSRSEKSGSKSRSVNETGTSRLGWSRRLAASARLGLGWSGRLGRQTRQRKSKLSNKQEEAKGKAQEV